MKKLIAFGKTNQQDLEGQQQGWEAALKDFNKALNTPNMSPRSLQQIKEAEQPEI